MAVWKGRFKAGDVVKFVEPWKFSGATQGGGVFSMDVEYTVMDIHQFQSQVDNFADPHTLLSPEFPEGSPDGNGRWVDESCLDFASEEPTEEEIAALFGTPLPCPTCHRPF